MRIVFRTLVVLVFLTLVGLITLVYTGVYNVAASEKHHPVTRFILKLAMERSVERHAANVQVAPAFRAARGTEGFADYEEMCVVCHGAPGVERSEIARGLNPEPPELAEEAEEWLPAQLFWITKHGIKMSGMPAFGPTHDDDRIWTLVAFVNRLSRLTADQYRQLRAEREAASGHHHGEGAGVGHEQGTDVGNDANLGPGGQAEPPADDEASPIPESSDRQASSH